MGGLSGRSNRYAKVDGPGIPETRMNRIVAKGSNFKRRAGGASCRHVEEHSLRSETVVEMLTIVEVFAHIADEASPVSVPCRAVDEDGKSLW